MAISPDGWMKHPYLAIVCLETSCYGEQWSGKAPAFFPLLVWLLRSTWGPLCDPEC